MAEKPRSALGKGLASLLPGGVKPEAVFPIQSDEDIKKEKKEISTDQIDNKDKIPGVTFALVDQIVPNPNQPRRDFKEEELKELSDSIIENGIIQPLVVRKAQKGYELIAGERRLRASKLAGIKQVPVVVRQSTDKESLELALIENIQRSDLNCVDTALAYFQLMEDFSLTQELVAKRVGKDRTSVANHLRLLRLSDSILRDLKKGLLTFGHGKALASLERPEDRVRAHKEIIDRSLSVRETEALVSELKDQNNNNEKESGQPSQSTHDDPITTRFRTLASDLTQIWGSRVKIKGTDKKGKIIFHYSDREELDRILAKLQNES